MADMPDEIYTVEGQGTNTNVISLPPPRPAVKGKPPKVILTPVKAKERSMGERAFDAVVSGAMHSQFGFAAGQRAYLRKVKGWSEDQINDFQKKVIDNIDRLNALDPAVKGSFKEDGAANIGRVATELFGNILGGVDPTYAFGPGKTPVARVLSQMAINSGVDAGSQAIEMERGLREKYDPRQTAMNAAAGAAIQAPQEIYTAAKRAFAMPVEGKITSGFGHRDAPKAGASTEHMGVDVKAALGTPVKAPEAGVVTRTGTGKKSGNWVELDHGDGVTTKYLHLDSIDVKVGDRVEFGSPFAKTGATGNVTGPHLHWAAYKNGKPIDPMTLKGDAVGAVPPMHPDDIARSMGEAPDERLVDGHLVPDDELDLAVEGRMIEDEEMPLDDLVARRSEQELDDFEREAMEAQRDPIGEREDIIGYDPRVEAEPKFPANDPRGPFPEATRVGRGDGSTNKVMPSDDLRPAITDTDGNVHVGEQGEDFAAIAKRAEDEGMPSHKYDLNGYVDKDGKFIPEKDVLTPEQVQHVEKAKAETTKKSKAQQLERERGIEPIDPNKGPDELLLTDEAGGGNGSSVPPSGGSSGGGSGQPGIEDVFTKLGNALKAGKKTRREITNLQAEERSRRVKEINKARQATSGVEGFYAEKAKLEGALPTKGYGGLQDLTEDEIKVLFDHVKNHPRMGWLQSIRAREGLAKMLQGQAPTKSEIGLLARTLPPQLMKDLMENQTFLQKAGDVAANVLNIPKALITSYDVSAPLRQGVFMIRRGAFWKSLIPMLRSFGSEKVAAQVRQEIYNNPLFRAMDDAGLAIPKFEGEHSLGLATKEEPYMTNYAQKIPVLGIGVKASERAFNTFVYKLRADVFTSIYRSKAALGHKWNQSQLEDLAKYVNSFTGRGDLGKFNNATPLLNTIFFSPKLLKSRIDAVNPAFYGKLDPVVRKEAMKDILAFATIATTVLGLAKFAGAEVGSDPRKADGWKIKVGNTRYDILGGEQQLVRLLGNVGTYGVAKGKELAKTGKLKKGHAEKTAVDNIGQFLRNKESPDFSFFHDIAAGNNAIGQPFDIKTATMSRTIPLPAQAWMEAAEDLQKQGVPVDMALVQGFAKTSPGLFGVSVSTYPPRPPKQKKDKDFKGEFKNGFGNSFKDSF